MKSSPKQMWVHPDLYKVLKMRSGIENKKMNDLTKELAEVARKDYEWLKKHR